jgi:hypothetical protein
LQRIINTIPNSNITGEKSGAINDLLSFYKKIKITIEMTPKNKNNQFMTNQECDEKNKKQAWCNCFDFEEIQKNLRKTIISVLCSENDEHKYNVLGFKEIRYFNNINLLDEFIELFPNTKIICNINIDIDKQSKSAWWKINPEKSKKRLNEQNNEFIKYCLKNENCYLNYKHDLFNIDSMNKLFVFLNENLDINEYKRIISNNVDKLNEHNF